MVFYFSWSFFFFMILMTVLWIQTLVRFVSIIDTLDCVQFWVKLGFKNSIHFTIIITLDEVF